MALDGKSWQELLPTLVSLRTSGCILKVNDLLVAEGADHLLPELSVYGRVMVDLKHHDIPNSVGNACQRLRPHTPWAVTVHASGHQTMLAAALDQFRDTDTMVLGVTVLTAFNEAMCQEVYHRQPWETVKQLAEIAYDTGADGLVCAPAEVGELRRLYPNMKLVVPGIRSAHQDAADQKRTGTPAQAMHDGASHLVVGRQILTASDPAGEVDRLFAEELPTR